MQLNSKLYNRRRRNVRWWSLSDSLLEKRNYTCQQCGFKDEDNKYVCVHHKYYIEDRDPWNYPFNAYQVLCLKCHNKINHKSDIPSRPNPFKKEMKSKPFIITRRFFYDPERFPLCHLQYNKYFDIIYYGPIIDCEYATKINQGDGRFDYELIVRECNNYDKAFSDRKSGKPYGDNLSRGEMRLENYCK